MQITVTVNIPDRVWRKPSQARIVRTVPTPPRLVQPRQREKVLRIMAPIAEPTPITIEPEIELEATLQRPVTVAAAPPPIMPARARKGIDSDALLRKSLAGYELEMWNAAASSRQFMINEDRAIAEHNKTAIKKHQPEMQANQEDRESEQGKADAYELVSEALKAIIAALDSSFDAYLDALPTELDRLESVISNEDSPYHQMRDSVLSEAIATIQQKWMGA